MINIKLWKLIFGFVACLMLISGIPYGTPGKKTSAKRDPASWSWYLHSNAICFLRLQRHTLFWKIAKRSEAGQRSCSLLHVWKSADLSWNTQGQAWNSAAAGRIDNDIRLAKIFEFTASGAFSAKTQDETVDEWETAGKLTCCLDCLRK